MKTLIEYAISCGNENHNIFRNEKWFGFTNENQSAIRSRNEPIRFEKNERKKNEPTLKTEWGTANVGSHGYYRITSVKEGNHGRLLHRLIYEKHYGIKLDEHTLIHHIDGNKLNNNINNLIKVSRVEHNVLHTTTPSSIEKIPASVSRNTTGYLHVYKQVCPKCKQGFTWKYTWKENGKLRTLESINIEKLEQKVKEKGLPWRKI